MPPVAAPPRPAPPAGPQLTIAPRSWRNPGFVVLSITNVVLTSQLGSAQRCGAAVAGRADRRAAHVVGSAVRDEHLMAVLLQVRAARGSETVDGTCAPYGVQGARSCCRAWPFP
jgi:hypothetical protein